MNRIKVWKASSVLLALGTTGMLSGCAHYEINNGHGNIPGHYIRQEMQEADRAVESARLAGKDKSCPEEFKTAEDAKNNAYDVFRACHTEEGAALAKEATAKANALCPPQALKPVGNPAQLIPEPAAPVAAAAEPAEAALVAIPVAEPTPDHMKYCISLGIEYDIDKADIRPEYRDEVAQVGDFMKKYPTTTAVIDCALDLKGLPAPPERLCMSLKVEFATDSAQIDPAYYDQVNSVGEYMKKYPTTTAVIEGHTDSLGTADHNLRLSQQRADSVVNYLMEKFGIETSRLSAKGYGATRRIAYNNTEAGRQLNRRINAIIDCVLKK